MDPFWSTLGAGIVIGAFLTIWLIGFPDVIKPKRERRRLEALRENTAYGGSSLK
jgi:hypothetical protein